MSLCKFSGLMVPVQLLALLVWPALPAAPAEL